MLRIPKKHEGYNKGKSAEAKPEGTAMSRLLVKLKWEKEVIRPMLGDLWGRVGSKGSMIFRSSQLELDVPVSVYPAPDNLRFPFCSCEYNDDRICVLPSHFEVSSYCGYCQCDGGLYLHHR